MLTVLRAETLKLNRSMVMLLTMGAPLMIPVLAFVINVSGQLPEGVNIWPMHEARTQSLWAIFMLPMTATALSALLGQIEHGTNTWTQIFAFPRPRWSVFAAKAIVTIGLLGVMSLLLAGGTYAGLWLGGLLNPAHMPTGEAQPLIFLRNLAMILVAATPLVALQLWTALRFKAYVPPILLGILGTFVAVAASGSKWGIFWPWLMPVNAVANHPDRPMQAFVGGAVAGLILLILAVIHLSRREVV